MQIGSDLRARVLQPILGLLLAVHPAQAELLSQADGALVYDTDRNITWMADANLFGTLAAKDPRLVEKIIAAVPVVYDTPNAFDKPVPDSGEYHISAADFRVAPGAFHGYMTWWGAKAWAEYYSFLPDGTGKGWRLPKTVFPDPNCISGYHCTAGELGHLYYEELGVPAGKSILSSDSPALALFINIQEWWYWTDRESGDPRGAFWFDPTNGRQAPHLKDNVHPIWLVHDGYLIPIPEPGSLALLGLGLMGLGLTRRRQAS